MAQTQKAGVIERLKDAWQNYKDEREEESRIQRDDGDKRARKRGCILILLILLIDMFVISWYAGGVFRNHPALGFNVGGIYPPWDILIWQYKWGDLYPEAFKNIQSMATTVTVFSMIPVLVVYSLISGKLKAKTDMYGTARWATWNDIKKAGLLSEASDSVVVGGFKDPKGHIRYLRHSGPEHVLTYAPTRSGKGVGLVIPTLLSWTPSCVIADLKGELWALTSGWRQKYADNRVLKFEPASKNSIHWNPLEEIRYGQEEMVGDVQNLATLIVDPDGKGMDDHWTKTAYALLTGVILYVLQESRRKPKDVGLGGRGEKVVIRSAARDQSPLHSPGKKNEELIPEITGPMPANLAMVDHLLSVGDPNTLWTTMAESRDPETNEKNKIIEAAANDMLARPDEEAGSVLSTAKSFLSLYRDPIVSENISNSEFRIKDLMYHVTGEEAEKGGVLGGEHTKPVSLYIVTQPNDKARLRPLVRIMVNMIVRLLADKMEFENGRTKARYNHRLLLMLDEFPSLGKLEILQESLAFIAGYGMKAYLITQDLNQLKSKETGYGEDESITSNCHVQNAYPPNRYETAKHLSEMTGQTTVVKEEVSISSNGGGLFGGGSKSKTMRESQRDLLTPDECMRMKGPKKVNGDIVEPGEMLIFVAGFPAIKGVQPLYFKDPAYSARAKIPAPKETDRIRIVTSAGVNQPKNPMNQQEADREHRRTQAEEVEMEKMMTAAETALDSSGSIAEASPLRMPPKHKTEPTFNPPKQSAAFGDVLTSDEAEAGL